MVIGLIVSGGKGLRMGSEVPKQFLPVQGVPILIRTLMAFDEVDSLDALVLVLGRDFIEYFKGLGYTPVKPLYIVEAGEERFSSVQNGLKKAYELDPESVVLIHDGVRPLVSRRIIEDGITYTRRHRAAACSVALKDTVKSVGCDGFSTGTLEREKYRLIQTPQCFFTKEILSGHERIQEIEKQVTDDTAVYEAFFGSVYLYEGSYENLKVTTPEDLLLAEAILTNRAIENCK